MPLAPAPLKTTLTWSIFLPTTSTPFKSAVLQVDAAEGGFEELAGADHLFRVFGLELDVEDVDVGEALEEHTLAFHHRLAGPGADIAEAEHGGAVRHHRHQVPLGRVLVEQARVALDLEAGHGDAGRVGQAQVALRAAGLGGHHAEFPRRRRRMVLEDVFLADDHGGHSFSDFSPRRFGRLLSWRFRARTRARAGRARASASTSPGAPGRR